MNETTGRVMRALSMVPAKWMTRQEFAEIYEGPSDSEIYIENLCDSMHQSADILCTAIKYIYGNRIIRRMWKGRKFCYIA